jgi:Uma2 family endonuclease
MVAVSRAAPMTAEELAALPDDGYHRYELVQGQLLTMCPSASYPGVVAGNVQGELRQFVRQHKAGVCGTADSGFLLFSNPDTVRAPDAWFVRRERVPGGRIPRTFWPGPPDIAVEVLSPTDRFSAVMAKSDDYLRAGTSLLWVIDPEGRTAAIFRPGRAPQLIGEDGVLDGEDVLPGFRLVLRDVLEEAVAE